MTQTVSVTRRIRRNADDVSLFITDMHELVPKVSTFKRCQFISDTSDGELWDIFMQSGTIFLGGRILATTQPRRLAWHSLRGTRHSFEALVEEDGDGSRLSLTLTYSLASLVTAWFIEFIGRGIASRTLEAAVEEIRHYLEYG
ncbi:hypothetical protein [Mycobacterium sp. 1274761.0]|uniref:hypothetical protein n=1 Tax=Mycobacterium sp. 1274761.0 TaxID=1834077 RepID=UPI0007FE88D3|nr:hypothetical protein [Mycobacterium sp. 1274761.0]OBK73987.1 hypothetical protein A5651_11815 [Mycobacterium sp. 1274761.0]